MESTRKTILIGQRLFLVGERLVLPSGRIGILQGLTQGQPINKMDFLHFLYDDEPRENWQPVDVHYKLVKRPSER